MKSIIKRYIETEHLLKCAGLDGTTDTESAVTLGVSKTSDCASTESNASEVDRPVCPKHHGSSGRYIRMAKSAGILALKIAKILSTPQEVSRRRQNCPPRHSVFQAWMSSELTFANAD